MHKTPLFMQMMMRLHIRVALTSLSSSRRYVSKGGGHLGTSRSASQAASSASCSASVSAPSSNAFGSSSVRIKPPSYLYRAFMGHSTPFAAIAPPLTRAGITQLEREPLAHSTPGRINDHICIGMVKTLRWLADRAFRERYIHRATMLVTVAAAAPAAGSVAAYLRMFFRRSNSSNACTGDSQMPTTAEASSPFLAFGSSPSPGAAPPIPDACRAFAMARPSLYMSTSSATMEGTGPRPEHSYVDELRGLLAQCESHAVHYQVLSCMAEITLLERSLVLLLQAVHFTIYLALFLFYPRMGFRLMAYAAEESSVVWTQMVNDVDLGKIAEPRVPQLALHYWGLEGVFTAQAAPPPKTVTLQEQEAVLYKTSEGLVAEQIPVADAPISGASPYGSYNGHRSATPPSRSADHVSVPFAAAASCDGSAVDRKESEERVVNTSDPGAGPGLSVLTLRDVALLIRSDEMIFRDLNHELANKLDMQPSWTQRLLASLGGEK
ncbi:putative alternative oxidase [Leishmania major strain Friedlin]|uniref:Alternative oxidase n=1 Tax=Leishmania major TaxID=5664 RepID=Q4Q0X6_LEIMA|nr:putative alternative oxidase [Leishmania major strain Friedlin]CAG9583985.1 alternative_oxidase_-_putative [Leishmania major strain Friedlin]CAJ09405.1 putative alternative oxidase [Leishmania major strain Friedlin]|eukprot:XP_001687022.1 putative alternative oxidase [Leishmania major strain Friedlin]